MNTKNKQRVEKVFRELIAENPSNVTTLEVKEKLRKDYPNDKWVQKEVSDVVADINLKLAGTAYVDNGTYREYFVIAYGHKPAISAKKTSVTSNTTKSAKKKATVTVRDGGKISKTTAVNKIKSSKGRFFTVTFTKKNGDTRVMNGNVRLDSFMNAQGYIQVREVGEGIKNVDPRKITALKIAGSQYTVG